MPSLPSWLLPWIALHLASPLSLSLALMQDAAAPNTNQYQRRLTPFVSHSDKGAFAYRSSHQRGEQTGNTHSSSRDPSSGIRGQYTPKARHMVSLGCKSFHQVIRHPETCRANGGQAGVITFISWASVSFRSVWIIIFLKCPFVIFMMVTHLLCIQ